MTTFVVVLYLLFFYLTVLFLTIDVMKMMNKRFGAIPDVLQLVTFIVIFFSIKIILAKTLLVIMETFS